MTTRTNLLLAFCCLAIAVNSGCGSSNNLFMGEVRATAGSHPVVVTDCYRLSVDPPRQTKDGYRYMPCRDADVVIRQGQTGPGQASPGTTGPGTAGDEEAVINGRSYGHVGPTDAILVDHGVVSISRR